MVRFGECFEGAEFCTVSDVFGDGVPEGGGSNWEGCVATGSVLSSDWFHWFLSKVSNIFTYWSLSRFPQSYDNGDSQLDSSELLKFIQQNESVVELQSYADQESNKLLRSVCSWFSM